MSDGVLLTDLVDALGGEIVAVEGCDVAQLRVNQFRPLLTAASGDISFLANPRYRNDALATRATVVVVAPSDLGLWADRAQAPVCIATANPYLYFAKAAQWLQQRKERARGPASVHPTAVIGDGSSLGDEVAIGAYAVLGTGVSVGAGTRIHPHVVIGDDVRIGGECIIYPNVVVYAGCVIGDRTILHAGVVIGADGFGFAPGPDGFVKIPQVGRAILGDDVEIGANTAVDRGALEDTVVGRGVKLDNLIQIGHNVTIGEHTVIAAHAAVAGSAAIGNKVMVGGCAGIAGHTEVGDGVVIGPMSMVSRSVRQAGKYVGAFPLDDERSWQKNAAALRRLDELRQRVRKLEAALAEQRVEKEDADGRT